jgi:hypothetical protein
VRRCNYLQSLENLFDDVHLSILHRGTYFENSPATVSAEKRAYGFISRSVHEPSGKERAQLFIRPNTVFILNGVGQIQGLDTFLWTVPRDDTSSHLFISMQVPKTDDPFMFYAVRDRVNQFPFDAEVTAILRGEKSLNDLNPDMPETFHIEDMVILESQGAIHDRRCERLGASDRSVMLLRRLLSREIGELAEGLQIAPASVPENLRAALNGATAAAAEAVSAE